MFKKNKPPPLKKQKQKITMGNYISSCFYTSVTPIQQQMSSFPTLEILKKQNAETSNCIIHYFQSNDDFLKLSKYEGDLTSKRDEEDGNKLQKGINHAKEKGVIDPSFVPEPYVDIDVLDRSPNDVAQLIVDQVMMKDGSSSAGTGTDSGVIVLVGLSGTGKGTTVAQLRERLELDHGKKVVTWSNGNVFRSVTLLAATWCEQQNPPATLDQALTKERLAEFMSMLSFDKFDGVNYDTRVRGLGLDLLVSQEQNTTLKSPKVSTNIPTVAEATQGEVILFAAKAISIMTSAEPNLFVLLEGRAQTVNYVPSPHRFCLILSDASLIGKRRAAQRIMGQALKECNDDESKVETALQEALAGMVKDISS